MSVDFSLPERPRILVITLRRLGDVLLTTPLVRTLRQGFPNATLDILVFRGSERILKGNPDIDRALTMPERPSLGETLAVIGQLWHRYDLVVSTQAGDRPTFFALLAGGRRIGVVPHEGHGVWWKRWVHHCAAPAEPDGHRVENLLRLTDMLGLVRQPNIICPQGASADAVAPRKAYAVLHANPMYRYKRWNDTGWRELAQRLAERGLAVVATEGRDPAERAYVDALWGPSDPPVIRERGQLDWPGLTALLRGASVYVGPDTSITHLAAGSGCPTVALYGPTSPRLIGPWPVGGLAEPWAHAGTIQRRGNVWVVQNPLPCMPCEKLGCERRLDSHSQCLDELSVRQVLAAVDQALTWVEEGCATRSEWRAGRKVGMEGNMPPSTVSS
jgi:heptosyltransferase-3